MGPRRGGRRLADAIANRSKGFRDGNARPLCRSSILNDMLDQTAGAVLSCYPALLWQGPLSPLGNHGGFSGARLWRVAGLSGMLCLRAWPEHDSAVRLAWRHRLMAA